MAEVAALARVDGTPAAPRAEAVISGAAPVLIRTPAAAVRAFTPLADSLPPEPAEVYVAVAVGGSPCESEVRGVRVTLSVPYPPLSCAGYAWGWQVLLAECRRWVAFSPSQPPVVAGGDGGDSRPPSRVELPPHTAMAFLAATCLHSGADSAHTGPIGDCVLTVDGALLTLTLPHAHTDAPRGYSVDSSSVDAASRPTSGKTQASKSSSLLSLAPLAEAMDSHTAPLCAPRRSDDSGAAAIELPAASSPKPTLYKVKWPVSCHGAVWCELVCACVLGPVVR